MTTAERLNIISNYIPRVYAAGQADVINRTIVEINSNKYKSIGAYGLYGCTNLKTAILLNVESVGTYAFYGCTNLENVFLPKVTSLGDVCFRNCVKLVDITVPNLEVLGQQGLHFQGCTSLTTLDFPKVTAIPSAAFRGCTSLKTLILRNNSLVTLSNTNAFENSGIIGTDGRVYVPSALINAYKSATNWSAIFTLNPNVFEAIENHPEITGG